MKAITWKFRFEYWAVRLLAALCCRMSRATAITFGGRLGILAGMLLRKRRLLAEENIRQAFPDWTEQQVSTTAWANFQHVGISSAEMLRLEMLRSGSGDLEALCDFSGMEHLDQALALGRGAIVLTGHLGFWELGVFAFPERGIAFDVVARPLKNPLTDTYVNNVREAFGSRTLNSRKGARKILKSLQSGHAVGILLDQHISPPGSVPTEFFGRKAYTTTAITSMAMKHQIPVVPVFSLRTAAQRYQVWAEPMLLLEGTGEAAVNENTQLLTQVIESAIRRDPRQWFWMHKRWRYPKKTAN